MEELIAKRYVNALVGSTSKKDRADFSKTLLGMAEAFSDAKVSEMLKSPLVSNEQKTSLILEGLGEDTNIKLVNFIKIIGENGRLDLLPIIAKVLKQAIQKETNKYEGIVTSSTKLKAEELKDLESSLTKYTDGASIKLNQEISDIEGIKVSVDDLGIEVNFSKQRVKEQLIDFITKSL
ncbi:MAG: ATP synthase delta chain (EC [uncultured Sulfurovum sp.]|uniref:ATP synthase subunit delta n=1 Tax=uncultured Sulfurovum sp. TaxID=269237 RepID=A0A6S6SX60_9BACT|nr:MAG: ATP synthase delta chain (EC [uncultured Sulfurovum sp.]